MIKPCVCLAGMTIIAMVLMVTMVATVVFTGVSGRGFVVMAMIGLLVMFLGWVTYSRD